MSAEAIAALPSIATAVQETTPNAFSGAAASGGAAGVPGFGDLVTQGLNHVSQQLMVSQTDLQQLSVGNVQNLHQIMIRLEESRLSFQLMMQVRSRLLEAYQDVMKMQV